MTTTTVIIAVKRQPRVLPVVLMFLLAALAARGVAWIESRAHPMRPTTTRRYPKLFITTALTKWHRLCDAAHPTPALVLACTQTWNVIQRLDAEVEP